MARSDLTVDLLRSLLRYDQENGEFYWKVKPCQRCAAGMLAGSLSIQGYRIIKVKGEPYKAHRLAWLYVHGEWPPGLMDHINLNKADNRISNLRLATNAQNVWNRPARGISGLKGVHWHPKRKKWQVQIVRNGRAIYLGVFNDPAEAHAVYCREAIEQFGEFARVA